jgi:[protein-PII] uridylyltransferase
VLYPLWDANLKVGHSVRTVKECVAAAKDRFETLTTLLSARIVAGDAGLMVELEAALARLVFGRPLSPRLVDEERRRRRTEPYPLMAADVKAGRGCLRTLQGFWWERRRAALLGLDHEPAAEDEEAALAALLAIRNALHVGAGRAFDSYLFDLREPAARWLGSDVLTVGGRLCSARRTVERLAQHHWPDLLVSGERTDRIGVRVARNVRSRLRSPPHEEAGGAVAIARNAATGRANMALSTEVHRRLAAKVDDPWTEADRAAFVELIGAGERGQAAFGWLEKAGWLERQFPEWAAVSALPQVAPFHEHPVDAHLWRTVDEMRALIDHPDPFTAGILEELGSTEELILAAFLHDVGKGTRRDHAEVGAEKTAGFLRRAGFGPTTQADVVPAVRHHLLLARIATRADTGNPDVIDAVADAMQRLRLLQIVYMLTIADARATARGMWTEWKATLLRELYIRVAGRFGVPGPETATIDPNQVTELAGGKFSVRDVAEHLSTMPDEYAAATAPSDVLWHLEALSMPADPVALAVDPSGRRVAVVGPDRSGFLLAVCRAFSAARVAVLDARLHTRGDGTVLDVFEVRDDRSGEPVPARRWAQVEETLAAVLLGRSDVRAVVEQRASAYPGSARTEVRVNALPSDSRRNTVLEIRAPDRVGLLATFAEALHSEGLDVHLARVDTRAGEAIDIFHVRRLGLPVRTESELTAMCRRLEDRIRS